MEHTADDLIALAESRGLGRPTPRLIVDWTELGLLDSPDRTGLGKGGGKGSAKGTWPENQAELFVTLLDQRRKQATKVSTLCNIPVFVWTFWGDEWVPPRQARKVLMTFGGKNRRASLAGGRWSARQMLEELGTKGGTHAQRRARQDYIETVARIASRGVMRGVDREHLVDLGNEVFAPEILASPMGAGIATGYARIVEARLLAISVLPDLSDLDMYWARHVLLQTKMEYMNDFPRLSRDPGMGHRYQPLMLEAEASNACISLLNVIGGIEVAKMEPAESATWADWDPRRSKFMESFRAAFELEEEERTTAERT